jgi:hypothetical protein
MEKEFIESKEEAQEYAETIWDNIYKAVEEEGVEKIPEILNRVTPHDLRSIGRLANEAYKLYGDEEHNQYLIEAPIARAIVEKLNFEKLNSLEAAYPIHQDNTTQTNPSTHNIPKGDFIPDPVAPVTYEKEKTELEFTENPLRNRIAPTKKPSPSAPVISVEEYSNYNEIEKAELAKASHIQEITDRKIEEQVANRWLKAQGTDTKLSRSALSRVSDKVKEAVSLIDVKDIKAHKMDDRANSPDTVTKINSRSNSPKTH